MLTTLLLYFQQIRPLAKCDADDGHRVGHLLIDLMKSKPTDPIHAIHEFVNRTAMLRECGFRHIGDMLVAMLVADAQNDSELATFEHAGSQSPGSAAQDVTAEQATAFGEALRRLANSVVSVSAPAAVCEVVSRSIFNTITIQHSWFVPMLEVLSARQKPAESRRASIMKGLGASVSVVPTVNVPSDIRLDSVVRLAIASHPV